MQRNKLWPGVLILVLAVTAFSGPATAVEGGGIDVSWTVANQGAGAAEGTWTDRVYLRQAGQPGVHRVVDQIAQPRAGRRPLRQAAFECAEVRQ